MTEISAALVKELREETNVGMMECKKALVEAHGDKQQAIKLLRERGLAIAGKKAARTAKDGLVAADLSADGKRGLLLEVDCETDFVARNEAFKAFVQTLLEKARTVQGELAPVVQDLVAAKIAEIGENIIVRRNVRFDVTGAGAVASYIHLGGKVGVLLEVGCEKESTTQQPLFKEIAKDLTLHIAACSPQHLTRDQVPAALVASESEIYAKQVPNKPAPIVEKIVKGKLEKFFSQICLVEQGFVKDPDQTVTAVLAARSKELGDTLTLRRFVRFQIGEQAAS